MIEGIKYFSEIFENVGGNQLPHFYGVVFTIIKIGPFKSVAIYIHNCCHLFRTMTTLIKSSLYH